ncbi:hypothetical protein COO55_35200 [Rhodococcus opacus]|nr:hypothetical protein FXW36_06000 [Rhodococcus opacus]RKM76702.1 hypothetical protein COO55_35200 [Rhodococcus opacus]
MTSENTQQRQIHSRRREVHTGGDSMPVSPHTLLQHVQDRTTDLRRWLDTGDNTTALTAYLRDEPVDHRWLTTYKRLTHDLLRAVDHARSPRAPHEAPTPDRR